MDKLLHDPGILAENVYNMDETGNLLSNPTSRKYVLHTDDRRRHRGVTIKRQLVTTVECIPAKGKPLSPLVIWPAATQRSDWTTHSTPGWHYTCFPKGYSNTAIILDWYRQVFDPETKQRANGRPRVLINDGFGPHECFEVQQFCRGNNIILCQLPSHTSHKLQPCDVSIFAPLKTAYRNLVEDVCSKGVKIIGKQHFTLLYDQARRAALTPSNIKSAWAKVGLYPFDPDRVLRDIQKPPNPVSQSSQTVDMARYDEPLRTPLTSEQFASLRKTIEQNMPTLDEHN
jgi:DDE superfamily endonuclease